MRPSGRLPRCALGLLALAGCPPSTQVREGRPGPPLVRTVSVPTSTPAERVRQLEGDLATLAGRDPASYSAAYARLSQRARDGDHAARTVQLVFGVRDVLREGCSDAGDQRALHEQLDFLLSHLSGAPPAEWVFAGPTVLLGLHAAGRGAEQPQRAADLLRLGREVLSDDPARLGELLFEITHALRLGCHLKRSLPLLEEAAVLLGQGKRRAAVLLCRRDLATLEFLLGDAASAARELQRLRADLQKEGAGDGEGQAATPGPGKDGDALASSLAARKEVVEVLSAHLAETPEQPPRPPRPPRDNGPGWQALRTVQQEASCPEATPGNPHLIRVPVPPPPCGPAAASEAPR